MSATRLKETVSKSEWVRRYLSKYSKASDGDIITMIQDDEGVVVSRNLIQQIRYLNKQKRKMDKPTANGFQHRRREIKKRGGIADFIREQLQANPKVTCKEVVDAYRKVHGTSFENSLFYRTRQRMQGKAKEPINNKPILPGGVATVSELVNRYLALDGMLTAKQICARIQKEHGFNVKLTTIASAKQRWNKAMGRKMRGRLEHIPTPGIVLPPILVKTESNISVSALERFMASVKEIGGKGMASTILNLLSGE